MSGSSHKNKDPKENIESVEKIEQTEVRNSKRSDKLRQVNIDII